MRIFLSLAAAALAAVTASAAAGIQVSTSADTATIACSEAPAGAHITVTPMPSALPLRAEAPHFASAPLQLRLTPGRYTATCADSTGRTLATKEFCIKEPDVAGTRIVVLSDTHTLAPTLIKRDGKALQRAESSDFIVQ